MCIFSALITERQQNQLINKETKSLNREFPAEIIEKILGNCSPLALLRIEHLTKDKYDAIIERRWSKLQLRDHYAARFADCEKEKKQNKWNYILNHVLRTFLDNYNILDATNGNRFKFCQKISISYETLFKRFPSIGCYIEKCLYIISNIPPPIQIEIENQRAINFRNAMKGFGGELFLHTLLEMAGASLDRVREFGTAAIEANAVRLVDYLIPRIPSETHRLELILLAGKKKYWNPLETFLMGKDQAYLNDLMQKEGRLPPILYYLSIFSNNPNQQDTLISEALDRYQSQAPLFVIGKAAQIKMLLQEWHKSDKLFRKVIEVPGTKLSADLLMDCAFVKFQIQQWKQADDFFQKSIVAFGTNTPPIIFSYAGIVKCELQQWKEADDYFQKAIAYWGTNSSIELYLIAAKTKLKLNQINAAKEFFRQSQHARSQKSADWIANLKKEVEQLLDQAIKDSEPACEQNAQQ